MPTAAEQIMQELVRSLQNHAPSVQWDTDAENRDMRILTIRNPYNERWSLQYTCPVEPDRRGELYGSLWFGAVEITGYLSAEEALDTIQAVLNGHITAVQRFRNRDAQVNHHPSGFCKVFLTAPDGDDDEALAALRERLARPVTFWERLTGTYVGIFEFANWQQTLTVSHMTGKNR